MRVNWVAGEDSKRLFMELLFKVLGLSQAWRNTEPWTLEAETKGSWIQGHSELHRETISNKQTSKQEERKRRRPGHCSQCDHYKEEAHHGYNQRLATNRKTVGEQFSIAQYLEGSAIPFVHLSLNPGIPALDILPGGDTGMSTMWDLICGAQFGELCFVMHAVRKRQKFYNCFSH